MRYIKFIFWIITAGLAFASFIAQLFPVYWFLDIFSHFKLQYVILSLFLLIFAFMLFKNYLFPVMSAIILLGWNTSFILPLYLQDADMKETSGETFSILAMNLLSSNTNYSDAIDLIREKDPDLVVLLELSIEWEKQMQFLNKEFPFRQLLAQQDNFGIGILSKIPMKSKITDFGKGFPPSILSQLQLNGQQISVLATHPVPPVNQDKFDLRNRQLEAIAKLSKTHSGNLILAGDLNSSSYSRHFQKLLENGKLKDSRKGFGIASTWPSNFYILRTTLDHFLLKKELKILERTVERSIGSDHLPIFLKVAL